jgi:hypothetical protein
MIQNLEFTPTAKEIEKSILAIGRSMAKEASRPLRQLALCLAMYGIPLAVAAFFFRSAFDQIYLTFTLFVVGVFVISRLGRGLAPSVAERYTAPQSLHVGEDGIVHKTQNGAMHWPWFALSRLHDLEEVLVLEFRDWSWAPLPRRLWPDEDAKSSFIADLRANAPYLRPDLPSASVPNPFTLINVGAGFAAVELFLVQIFGATWVLWDPENWRAAIRLTYGSAPLALVALFIAATLTSVAGFFGFRYVLRSVQRKHARMAAFSAATFIVLFVVLAGASVIHRPCGC